MTTRTRYFVIISLLVLGVGLGTGLVAYYVGFPAGALGRQGGPEELAYVPQDLKDATAGDIVAHRHSGSLSVSFMEPGLAAIGSTKLIRSAIDLHRAGNNPRTGLESVTGNEALMSLVREMDSGNVWAVGRF